MGLMKMIITAAITALGLAAWNLYLSPFYHEWIKMQGRSVGLAEEAFAYFIVLMIVWTIATIISKRVEENGN